MTWKTAYRSIYYDSAPEPADPDLDPTFSMGDHEQRSRYFAAAQRIFDQQPQEERRAR